MTLAPDAINLPAMVPASDRLSVARNRGMRLRSCPDCGKVDEVRADNPSLRCKRCATRSTMELGRDQKSAGRNRETCQHCRIVAAARTVRAGHQHHQAARLEHMQLQVLQVTQRAIGLVKK